MGLLPLLGGCGSFYVLKGPEPEPAIVLPPTPGPYPFDPAQGTTLSGGSDKGKPLNGVATGGVQTLPSAFRAADVVFAPRTSTDTANFTPLLVLQPIYLDAQNNVTSLGTTDTNNPYRLAGVIVPAPNTPGYLEALQAMRNWAQGQPEVINPAQLKAGAGAAGAGATAIPTPRPTVSPAARGTATISVAPSATPRPGAVGATPVAYIASQNLDVYEDPRYPIDSENRRLVQVFFKSVNGSKDIPKGTSLSLNRLMVRSGWAVVDLYSPTSFDQQTWLLDEAYARERKLGLWGYGIALQQRPPAIASGSGAGSSISVITGVSPAPGAVPDAGRAVRGAAPTATPVPNLAITPVATATQEPRLRSGTTVVIGGGGPSVKLPAPSTSTTTTSTTSTTTSSGPSAGPSSRPSAGRASD